ncbi:anti-repressor SinI family protein [Microbacteriaceae bacterium 4G12]
MSARKMQELDREWIALILEAKQNGITKEEILKFLHEKCHN